MSWHKGAILNQYSVQQVAFWIDGYYSVIPGDPERNTEERAFDFAKRKCIEGMQIHIAELEAMPFERFSEMKRRGI